MQTQENARKSNGMLKAAGAGVAGGLTGCAGLSGIGTVGLTAIGTAVGLPAIAVIAGGAVAGSTIGLAIYAGYQSWRSK
jgi:hypothetical protein